MGRVRVFVCARADADVGEIGNVLLVLVFYRLYGMIRGLTILAFLFFFTGLMAQKEANVWVFGNQSIVDFNSGAPKNTSGSSFLSIEACASISDDAKNFITELL